MVRVCGYSCTFEQFVVWEDAAEGFSAECEAMGLWGRPERFHRGTRGLRGRGVFQGGSPSYSYS